MAKSKRHHIVPKFLLDNFVKHGTTLFVYDKQKDEVLERNPKKALSFSQFNTVNGSVALETFYSQIESTTAPIIKTIIKERSLQSVNQSQIETLFYFILLQMIRTNLVRSHMEAIYKRAAIKGTEFIERIGLLTPIPDDIKKIFGEDITIFKLIESGVLNIKIDLEHIKYDVCKLAKNFSDNLTYFISNKKFGLLSSSGKPFYISDNAVGIDSFGKNSISINYSIMSPKVCFYLPLSHNLLLVVVEKTHPLALNLKHNDAYPISANTVKAFNVAQAKLSTRYIVCSEDNFELIRELIKENPDIKRGSYYKLQMIENSLNK